MKNPVGRPPKQDPDRLRYRVSVGLSAETYAKLKEHTVHNGMSLHDYLRHTIMQSLTASKP